MHDAAAATVLDSLLETKVVDGRGGVLLDGAVGVDLGAAGGAGEISNEAFRDISFGAHIERFAALIEVELLRIGFADVQDSTNTTEERHPDLKSARIESQQAGGKDGDALFSKAG